jgi:xanthine dehydrogenase YagS FAD-binding subunit
MNNFEYACPSSKEEVVRLLAEKPDAAAVLAGGTDLLSLMKDYVVTPERVVSLKSVEDLHGISFEASQGVRVGALVRLDELIADPRVKRDYPSLVQAVNGIRSPQLHNMGTVAGELCQRPRCWYYRNGFGLLARYQGKSLVLEGDNRYHAILGNAGPAYFVSPSSLAPALIALGAYLKIFGPQGERNVALEKFYRIPRTETEREYDLAPDEIVTDVLIPTATRNQVNATYEVRQREGMDWPLAAAAVWLDMRGDRIDSARVVLGHVAPTPWIATAAERALKGKPLDAPNAEKAGEAAVQGAKPLRRNAYKVRLARVAVKRAILLAAENLQPETA